MFIKIKNKKIEIRELTSFKDRIKSLRFVLEPIDYGVKIPNKSVINTYYFCQRVDVCVTDQEGNIIRLIPRLKSEKLRFLGKKCNIYYLPLNTCELLNIGDVIEQKNRPQ